MAQTVKKPSATRETWVQSLVQEEPLEKGVATHSSILTWRVPWREEPGGLQSMHMCMLSCFSRVQLFVTPWTVARQAPLSRGILQARILEWVAMSSSRGSSQPRDQTGLGSNWIKLDQTGSKPTTLMSPQMAGGFFITSTTWEAWATFHGIAESNMIEQLTFSFSHLSLTPVQASKVDRSLL